MATQLLEKGLKWAGIFFLGKLALEKIGNAAYNNIDYQIGRPSLDFATAPVGSVRVRLPLTITNSNPVTVRLQDVRGTVSYGNILLANVDLGLGGVLATGQVQTFTLLLDIPAGQVINDIVRSFQQQGTYSTLINVLIFRGTIYTNLVNIPITTNINLA